MQAAPSSKTRVNPTQVRLLNLMLVLWRRKSNGNLPRTHWLQVEWITKTLPLLTGLTLFRVLFLQLCRLWTRRYPLLSTSIHIRKRTPMTKILQLQWWVKTRIILSLTRQIWTLTTKIRNAPKPTWRMIQVAYHFHKIHFKKNNQLNSNQP